MKSYHLQQNKVLGDILDINQIYFFVKSQVTTFIKVRVAFFSTSDPFDGFYSKYINFKKGLETKNKGNTNYY